MSDSEKADAIAYKITRAWVTLEEAELLLKNNYFNAAANRMYYACFYAVSALLAKNNINARKHSGVIQMFGLHFVSPGIVSKENGKLYTELFDMRQSGDYVDFIDFEREDVAGLLPPAKQLIDQIEQLLSKQ